MMRSDVGVSRSTPVHDAASLAVAGTEQVFMGLVLAVAVLFPRHDSLAMSVDLGSASGFAVLTGSGMTFAGPEPTTVTGDIGTFPTATVAGLANLVLAGVNHSDDALTQQAKADLSAAFSIASGRTPTTLYGTVFDLGERTLIAGVYNVTESFGITGTLTLDVHGDSNAVWIFQAGSTLTAESGSKVILLNGAQAGNVIWQVGSSATLKTDAYFTGSILALTSITLNTGATVDGRVLAQNGSVTFDNNALTVPEGNTLQLLGIGLAVLATVRRRFKPPV